MEIPLFDDKGRVPQPREKVRIESVRAQPYPDRFRVFLEINVTAFQERPNLLVVLRDATDRIVSELNIIETMHFDMEFTLHIRNVDDPAGRYTLTVDLFYENRNPPQDRHELTLEIPPASVDATDDL